MDFWSKFWPVFASSILSGVILTFIIGVVISRLRRPKIKICLSIGTNFNGHRLMFYAINTGKVGLMPNEMQWNIYFPMRIEPTENFKKSITKLVYKNKAYNNVTGFNEKSILPGDSHLLIHIPVKVRDFKIKNPKSSDISSEIIKKTLGDFEWIDEAKYYYSLTTTRGQKKYEKFFWDYFKRKNYIEDSSFIKRPIFEVTEKII